MSDLIVEVDALLLVSLVGFLACALATVIAPSSTPAAPRSLWLPLGSPHSPLLQRGGRGRFSGSRGLSVGGCRCLRCRGICSDRRGLRGGGGLGRRVALGLGLSSRSSEPQRQHQPSVRVRRRCLCGRACRMAAAADCALAGVVGSALCASGRVGGTLGLGGGILRRGNGGGVRLSSGVTRGGSGGGILVVLRCRGGGGIGCRRVLAAVAAWALARAVLAASTAACA